MRSVQTGLARLSGRAAYLRSRSSSAVFLVACCALGAIGQLVNPRQAGTPTSAPAAAAAATTSAGGNRHHQHRPSHRPRRRPHHRSRPHHHSRRPHARADPAVGEGRTSPTNLRCRAAGREARVHAPGGAISSSRSIRASGRSDIWSTRSGPIKGTRLAAAADAVYLEMTATAPGRWRLQALGRNDAQGRHSAGR